MSYDAKSEPYAEVSLQITRADGTVVPIGPVGRTRHRSPLHRLWYEHVTKPRTERRTREANLDAARRAASLEE